MRRLFDRFVAACERQPWSARFLGIGVMGTLGCLGPDIVAFLERVLPW